MSIRSSIPLSELPPDLVWKAGSLAWTDVPGHPTGFSVLDDQLPGSGWPRGALVELLSERPCAGEVMLLLPLMRSVPAHRWCAWIAPPHAVHAPALEAAGLPLSRLLLITPPDAAAALWATRLALQSQACHVVLAWLPHIDTAGLRRLQLAAEEAGTTLFLLRPTQTGCQPSPAVLRLHLQPVGTALQIHILKRRGPMHAAPLRIEWPQGWLHCAERTLSAGTPVASAVSAIPAENALQTLMKTSAQQAPQTQARSAGRSPDHRVTSTRF